MTSHQAYAAVRDATALRGELARMLAAFSIIVVLLFACLALERVLMRRAGCDDVHGGPIALDIEMVHEVLTKHGTRRERRGARDDRRLEIQGDGGICCIVLRGSCEIKSARHSRRQDVASGVPDRLGRQVPAADRLSG